MFNVTIIKLKDIVKIGIILILIYVFSRFILKKFSITNYLNENISFNSNELVRYGINLESNIINNISNEELQQKTQINIIKNLFDTQTILKTGSHIFNSKETENQVQPENIASTENTDTSSEQENIKTSQINTVSTDVQTQVVTQNPLIEKYTREYFGVKIKNETDYELTDEMLNASDLKINSKNVIIFHTHTCESYTQSVNSSYEPTGNYRTTDLNYSVARVGDELEDCLKKYDFSVNHNKTFHDYPAYTGSYSRSCATVSEILKTFSSDIIIDLHRDAIGSKEDYAPLVKIGDDYCAQLMFVLGTNGGKLQHPDWNSNLKFAVKVQQKANEIYPGLFKPIILRNSRYNQHLGKAACIIEVGATGNTLEQSVASMKYLSNVINEALK